MYRKYIKPFNKEMEQTRFFLDPCRGEWG